MVMKKIMCFLVMVGLACSCIAATDSGDSSVVVTPTGMVYNANISGFGSKYLKVSNLTTNYVYANINSTMATVVTNVALGSGFVPIAGGSSQIWEGFNIANVALCTSGSITATVDVVNYNY
jgi:hypothetical protein